MKKIYIIGIFLVSAAFFGVSLSVVAQTVPYQMKVLSLRFFPLNPNDANRLDTTKTGIPGIGDSNLATINDRVSDLQQNGLITRTEATKYHGHSNSSAPASLNYSLVGDFTYYEALPLAEPSLYAIAQMQGWTWEGKEEVYRPDYRKILSEKVNICDYVDRQGVREVWIWGYHTGPGTQGAVAPYTEPTESNMSMGTKSRSFWKYATYGDVSNSERTDDLPVCENTYYVYNYNYSRVEREGTLEVFGHQLEATYNFIDPGLFSIKFVNPYGKQDRVNSCGDIHEPPNSRFLQSSNDPNQQPYDWANPELVSSNCEDWHPDGSGTVKQINCHTWPPKDCSHTVNQYTGRWIATDGGVAYKKWWMQNIPGYQNGLKLQGANLINWWDFIGDFDAAMQKGKRLTDTPLETTPPTSAITAPPRGSWQNDDLDNNGVKDDRSFSVSITDADEEGGAGLDVNSCRYGVYDAKTVEWKTENWTVWNRERACNSSINISVGTNGVCSTEGRDKCLVLPWAADNIGNQPRWLTDGSPVPAYWFSIDWTNPNTPTISYPAADSVQTGNFQVGVSGDGDSGGSGNNCYYDVYDQIAGKTKDKASRTCKAGSENSLDSFEVTVGPEGDCRTNGGFCTIEVYAQDGAGNTSTKASRSFDTNFLTFPTDTWQRLWYTTSGTSPNVILDTFLGENTVSSLENVDWKHQELYTKTDGTKIRDNIGFKASRTLTGLTPGAYTISVGADDGIKLFIEGVKGLDGVSGSNLLPSSAWDNNHSWDDNRHTVRVELGSTAKIEIQYRENTGDAKISFAYSPGFTGDTVQGFACYLSPPLCTSPPASLYYTDPWCGFNKSSDGYCYYNGVPSTSGCDGVNENIDCSRARTAVGTCTYGNRCQVQAGQTCTDQGCVEAIPPTIAVRTVGGQWHRSNLLLDIDVQDDALSRIIYQIDTHTADQNGRPITSDGSTPLTVSTTASAPSFTQDFYIVLNDNDNTPDSWDDLSEGVHLIYIKAIDTWGNCKGCQENDREYVTIKKDSLPPSSTLNVAGAKTGTDPAGRHWFNTGKSISVEDREDETPGVGKFSGLNTAACYYKVQDLGRPEGLGNPTSGFRTCGSAVSVTVGSSASSICQTQGRDPITGRGYCRALVQSYDLAGNTSISIERLNIDYTPPGAQ